MKIHLLPNVSSIFKNKLTKITLAFFSKLRCKIPSFAITLLSLHKIFQNTLIFLRPCKMKHEKILFSLTVIFLNRIVAHYIEICMQDPIKWKFLKENEVPYPTNYSTHKWMINSNHTPALKGCPHRGHTLTR